MVSRRYRICIDVDLAVDELVAKRHTKDSSLSACDQSHSCVIEVQRLLLDDPCACDRWLRQFLLWYLQDGVLQEQLRNAATVSDATNPLGSIVGRLTPAGRQSITEWTTKGIIFEELRELYDSISVRRAMLKIIPVTDTKRPGVPAAGAVRTASPR